MRAGPVIAALLVIAAAGAAAWFALRDEPAAPPSTTTGTAAATETAGDTPGRGTPRAQAPRKRESAGAGIVLGALREHGTDRPLAGVPVELVPPGDAAEPLRGTSAADGAFHFDRVPAASGWTFRARVAEPRIDLEQAGINVVAGRTSDLGVIYAVAPVAFGGIVVDAAGTPVEGASVRVLRPFQFGRQSGLSDLISAFTDDPASADAATSGKDGRFRLTRTPPGTFDVTADAVGHGRAVERITLAPGVAPAELRLVVSEGFTVTGRIVRTDGGRVEGHRVRAMPREGLMAMPWTVMPRITSATSDAKGEFRLEGLARGTWSAIVFSEGELAPDQKPFDVPSTAPIEIQLGGDALLAGRILGPDGKGVAGARIIVNGGSRGGIAASGDDGAYEIRGLTSGTKVNLIVEARGFVTHGSLLGGRRMRAMLGEEDDSQIALAAGRNERDVTLERGGTLKGRVVEKGGEKGLEGVRVVVRGGGLEAIFGGASAFSDATGAFEVPGLADGTHTASLEKRGWSAVGAAETSSNPMEALMRAAMAGDDGEDDATDSGAGLTIVVKDAATVQRKLEMERATVLAGKVVDAAGAAVAGASVKATSDASNPMGFDLEEMMAGMFGGGGAETVTTDANGAYELTVTPGKSVRVAATAAGFVEGKSDSLRGDAGARVAVADLTLSRGATLEGVVTAAGAPVADAEVTWAAAGPGMFGGMRAAMLGASGGAPSLRTDAEGRFRTSGVKPGKVDVTVRKEGFRPSVTKNVAAADGNTATVDVTLDPGVAVTGLVLGPSGTPLAGASVRCTKVQAQTGRGAMGFRMDRAPDESGSATSGPDGAFTMSGLAPGSYEVRASAKGMLTNDPVTTAAGSPCTVRLAEALRIAGFVRCNGRPVAGVEVGAEPQDDGAGDPMARMRARMAAMEDSMASGSFTSMNATTNADGAFEIGGLRPGAYVLSVEDDDGTRGIQPAKVTGVAAGTLGVQVECKAGLEIHGSVTLPDGTLAKGGTVSAEPADADVEAETDEDPAAPALPTSGTGKVRDGAFRVGGLAPGKYTLTVSVSGYAGLPVAAEAGARGVQIRLTPCGTVTGKVVGADGKPVRMASVSVEAPEDEPDKAEPSASSMTNAKGEFTLKGVPPGKWRVVVHSFGAAGISEGSTAVTVRANETAAAPAITMGAPKKFEMPEGMGDENGEDD